VPSAFAFKTVLKPPHAPIVDKRKGKKTKKEQKKQQKKTTKKTKEMEIKALGVK
jgi:hypothetical protein